MPQKGRIPLKTQMPNKGGIPQAIFREKIGKANNERNDKNKLGFDQARLNDIANNMGQTPAPDNLLTLEGLLFLSHIFRNVRLVDPPEQQTVIKKNAPAFEATTRIDVRREGNQTRIHSFVSTSTINRGRIQSLNTNQTMSQPTTAIAPLFASTSSLFGNQTSAPAPQDIDIAKRAHELSVFFHQKVHDLYQLVNCTTTRRTDQVKTWIVTGESVEQTSFITVCQEAIGKAEAQNNQGMKQESENPTFASHHMTNITEHGFRPFSAEEAAQKLSKAFQAAFENKHNATIDTPDHIHNQVTETFWNGLTERFHQFFFQHEHTPYAQEQEDANGSLMSYFVDLLLQTFSIDYGKQVPSNPLLEKNLNYLVKSLSANPAIQTKKKQPEGTPEMVLEPVREMTSEAMMGNESVLNPEKESFLSQIWQLATDFYGVVDGFLQQSIGLQFLGAQARPLPLTSIPSLELEENKGTFNETQISETTTGISQVNTTSTLIEVFGSNVTQAGEIDTTQEINEKIQAFLRENADNPTKIVAQETTEDSDLPEWTSEQKKNIRKKLVDFFLENGIVCQESNARELMETVGEWVLLEGATSPTLDMVKVKQIAKLILGMNEEAVISEKQASLTVGTWVYETIRDNQPTIAFGAEAPEQTTGMNTTQSTSSPQPTSTDKQKNNVVETDGIQWRDPEVRKQVEAFFQQKKLLSDQPTKEELLIAIGTRVTKEENNKLVFNHTRIRPLAKVILKALKIDNEKNGEEISNKDAELTVMKWVFETMLGSSIEAYIVKTLVSAPDIDQFTMGRLRDLFTVRNLEKQGLIQLDVPTLSQKQKRRFNKLWNFLLQQELPNYFLDSSGLADSLLISDYASLMQLTGAKILKEGGYLESFGPEDSRLMGQHFWETILEKGITTYEEFRHLLIPSLLAVAQLEPNLLREALVTGTYKEVAISTFIGYQKEGYFQLVEHQELLNRLYKAYQEALLQWRRKEALATNVAEKCRSKGSRAPFYIMKQNYLLGLEEPCRDIDWSPPKLEDEYIKLTKNVSETHFPFDKKLIEFALNAVDQKEFDFIFSKTTILYEGFAELKNETHYTGGAPGTGGMLLININGRVPWEDTTLSLDKTDLFVAVQGKEERWYALKRLDEEGGYILYRVDQDPLSYLKYGLFNRKDLWGKGYQQVGNEIRIGNKYFQFSARVNRSKKLSHGVEMEPLIETLSRKHSDQLYDQLYDSGNDKADIEKAWDVIKHFIPFYDCVTGIIDRDTGQAVVSCTIDALLMIPVLGQITSLNMKFALGVARAFARGGIRNVIRSSSSFLPTMAETRRLVLTFARALDPGFETLIGGGRLIVRKLVSFKNELRVGKKIKDLLERVETMEKAQGALKKSIEMLEWNGLEVPVKKVNDHLYMRVTNLETAEVFGGLFMKKGNRLEAYRSATFTNEQLKLINLLEVKLDENQAFVVGVNPNPQAYGTGEITTVAKEGEETKRFIRMKGKLIEVTMTAIKEHGIRLDVYAHHSGKILPVNFNGMEWYFEAPTARSVAKEVEKEIASTLDQFETRKNPTGLSAPDGKGLMWDKTGRSYIKINDHYIPLVALDKNGDRYHLVKKDYNESMTILRFDAKNSKFRFETDLERQQVEVDLKKGEIRSRGGKSSGRRRTTQEGEIPSTSQGTVSQSSNKVFPPYNKLPPSPGKGELWTEIRKAVKSEKIDERVEDPSVLLPPLSKFISDPVPIVADDEYVRKTILEDLDEEYNIPYRVFVGLHSRNVPPFLKPFVRKIAGDVRWAMGYFDAGKKIYKKLLKKPILSETREGDYLSKMFRLEGLANQEEILRKIIKRLLSVAEKGEKFLSQSSDWGFENILIVSSDLAKEEGSQLYHSLLDHDVPKARVIINDPECRIIIFADAFHLDPDMPQGEELETIIHETAHITSRAEDLMELVFPESDFLTTGEELMDQINNNFSEILESESLENFVEQLAKEFDLPNLSKEAVIKALNVDPILRTNFLLRDAEILMTILRDFVEGRGYNELIRIKRSTDNVKSGNGFIFLLQALVHTSNYKIIKKTPQLDNIQELSTKKSTDNISTEVSNKEVSGAVGITNWAETTEPKPFTTHRSSLNLVSTRSENKSSNNQFVSDQQVMSELPQISSSRSSLHLVTTNTGKNTNSSVFNQQRDRNFSQPTTNSFLNLVTNGRERSTQATSTKTINQQINKNQKEPALQY